MEKVIYIGKRFSAISFMIAIVIGLLQILSSVGLISHPWNLYLFFLPYLLLAPAFLITTICFDIPAHDSFRKCIITSWVLATMNCTMLIMAYCYQQRVLTASSFNWLTGSSGNLAFTHPAALVTVKYASCIFISASTFILAFAFRKRKARWLFRSLLMNGLMLPLLVVSYIYPKYYFLASAWIVTFPFALFHITRFFTNEEGKLQKKVNTIHHPLEWVIQ
jgi:hypothetical protein